MISGQSITKTEKREGNVEEKYIKNKTQLEKLLQDGFVKRVEDRIVICEECFNVANQIILKLV